MKTMWKTGAVLAAFLIMQVFGMGGPFQAFGSHWVFNSGAGTKTCVKNYPHDTTPCTGSGGSYPPGTVLGSGGGGASIIHGSLNDLTVTNPTPPPATIPNPYYTGVTIPGTFMFIPTDASPVNSGRIQVFNNGELYIPPSDATHSGILTNNGILEGTGLVTGNVSNDQGVVSPGFSAGTVTVNGNFGNLSNGTLQIELGGITKGTDYDWLHVTGTATLGGALDVELLTAFTPTAGEMFTILTADGGITSGSDFSFITNMAGQDLKTLGWLGFVDPGNDYILEYNPSAVPEPSTMLLLGLGLICLTRIRKSFRNQVK